MGNYRGRIPGSKNKRTVLREHLQKTAASAKAAAENIEAHLSSDSEKIAALDKILGPEWIGQSLDTLGLTMGCLVTLAKMEKKLVQRIEYLIKAAEVAEKLGPYRYAKLSSVHVGVERKDALAREGVTEREVMAEIIATVMDTDGVSRDVKAFLESKVADNSANNSATNSASGGGVGNR